MRALHNGLYLPGCRLLIFGDSSRESVRGALPQNGSATTAYLLLPARPELLFSPAQLPPNFQCESNASILSF